MDSDPDGKPEEKKGKKNVPNTMVEVICEGCRKPINIRVKDKSVVTKQCHNDLHIIEVHVFTGGQIKVWQANQDGSNRHETTYQKVWQE
ncbi:MAG: hypothetical protein ABIO63_09020 [Casimicrobiaceae bacterium]